MIATNPLRQFVVQGHQATTLAGLFPKYVLSQGLARDTAGMLLGSLLDRSGDAFKQTARGMGKTPGELSQMLDEWRMSGLPDSISSHNLLEKSLDETVRFTRVKRAKEATIGRARKIGFEAGEHINMLTAFLAHRDKAIREGATMTSRDLDLITAKTRNFTYNMNRAGEFPYNKQAASVLTQFLQVPHKASTQVLTNRILSRKERAQMGMYHAVFLPLPAGFAYGILAPILPEDPDARELLINGAEGYIFNQIVSAMTEGDTEIDFSSFRSVDPLAPWEFIHKVITMDFAEIFKESPAGSLFAGHNPRFANVVREAQKFFQEPDGMSVDQLGDFLLTLANTSSGFKNMSTAYRELTLRNYGQRVNSLGIETENVTTVETLAKAFGLDTFTTRLTREFNDKLYLESKAFKDDIKNLYDMQKQSVVNSGVRHADGEYHQQMIQAMNALDLGGKQKDEWVRLFNKDLKKGEMTIMNYVYSAAGFKEWGELKQTIMLIPDKTMSQEKKNDYIEALEGIRSLGKETE